MRSMRLTFMGLALAVALGACGAAPREAGGQAQAEGIAVHGLWQIAIRNPDGSLDREHAFENAMIPAGADFLGRLLARGDGGTVLDVSRWLLAFGAEDGPVPGVGPCSLQLGAMTWSVSGRDPDLTTACVLGSSIPGGLDPSGDLAWTAIPGGLRLAGAAEATQDGTVNLVETWLVLVNPDNGAAFAAGFTGTSVGPFDDIVAGQSIQVTVDITFATPAS